MKHPLSTGGLLYIAAPFTSKSAGVQKHRANVAQMALDVATTFDALAYSPLNHLHDMMPRFSLLSDDVLEERDAASWFYAHGLGMLRRCDALVVLTLEGWTESVGVRMEIDAARQLGIPITYVDPALLSNDLHRRQLGERLRYLCDATAPDDGEDDAD